MASPHTIAMRVACQDTDKATKKYTKAWSIKAINLPACSKLDAALLASVASELAKAPVCLDTK